MVDIPLGLDDQPNVWISAAFLRDSKFYQSQRNLKVPAVQQQLQIDVRPAKPQFQPGEKAVYAVLGGSSRRASLKQCGRAAMM